jgi:ribose transport system ATP-binding protein
MSGGPGPAAPVTAPAAVAGDMVCEVDGLTKRFGATVALDDVSLTFRAGEVLGLIGENGAGKSTLLKCLCGIHAADHGVIRMRGEAVKPRNYREATTLGISMVFQEQALVPNLSVAENIFLSHEERFESSGILQFDAMSREAARALEEMNLQGVDPRRQIGEYSFATRQLVEIAKALTIPRMLGVDVPLILLDEPTSALSPTEAELLFERIRALTDRAAIVFVSHRLSELKAICDRMYVLKDGRVSANVRSADVSESAIHELMVGRKRDAEFYKETRQLRVGDRSDTAVAVRGLSVEGELDDISFDVHPGEIVGVGGVVGCGKSMLGRVLAGLERHYDGEISITGSTRQLRSVRAALSAGIGYVPAERHLEGLLLYFSVRWNIALPLLEGQTPSALHPIDDRAEKDRAARIVERLRIKPPSVDALIHELSGGNQQKVVLGKWLARELPILVLDNPTRGVDVGAKEEIYEVLRDVAADGMAIVLITDDLLELIGLSNRILVMREGRVSHDVDAPVDAKPREVDLVRHMV